MTSYAFWINPSRGIAIYVSIHHINTILDNPALFSFTRKELENVYSQYGEKIGFEGKAREVIMKEAILKGWIRIRKYPARPVIIEAAKVDDKLMNALCLWAMDILSGIKIPLPEGGKLSVKEFPYTEIMMKELMGQTVETTTVKDLASKECTSSLQYIHDRSLYALAR